MQLAKASCSILSQLNSVVEQIEEKDFSLPCPSLGNASVGQHLRHTLEFFLCLESGCSKGVVNYDRRPHDKLMESDKSVALLTIHRIKEFISGKKEDFALMLEVGYELESEESVKMQTNYFRELTYNIEHTVHHMAIMKIGLKEIAAYVLLPPDFGIAASTIRYKESSVVISR
ncbi:MAG: hypothetical protein KF860_01760 [Cyclobacteriaceae bacterium]|nr:hypothetical protein [Cyclobacteriaceae bacterium]